MLRATLPGAFEIVGDCYFYHLEDEQGILGPLPLSSEVQVVFGAYGLASKQFHDVSTGENVRQDPRLNNLFPNSERLPMMVNKPDPVRNTLTEEVMDEEEGDFQLTCDALVASGVELETFRLY